MHTVVLVFCLPQLKSQITSCCNLRWQILVYINNISPLQNVAEQRTWTIRKRLWSSAPSLVSNNHWRAKKMSRGDVSLWCRKRLNVEWTSWTTIISMLGNFIRLVYRCIRPIRGLPFSEMFHFHCLESNRQRGCVMRWSTPDELTPLELPLSIWYIILSVNEENHLSPLNSLLLEFSHQKKKKHKSRRCRNPKTKQAMWSYETRRETNIRGKVACNVWVVGVLINTMHVPHQSRYYCWNLSRSQLSISPKGTWLYKIKKDTLRLYQALSMTQLSI